MDDATKRQLHALSRAFYDERAEAFDASRVDLPWPGWERLRSQLPDNASPFMIQDQQLLLRRDVVEQSRRDHSQALAAAMNLQKIMRPEGRPINRHLVDSVSKCVDWLDKNFA